MKDIILFSNAFVGLVKQYLSYKNVSFNIPDSEWNEFRDVCKKLALRFMSGGCVGETDFACNILSLLEDLFRKFGVVIPDPNKHSSEDVYNLDNDVYIVLENSILELSLRYLSGDRSLANKTANPRVNHESLTSEVIEVFKGFLKDRKCSITVSKKDWSKLACVCKPRKIEWLHYKDDNYSLSYYHVWAMDIYVGHFVSLMTEKGYKFDCGVYDNLVPAIKEAIPNHVDWTPFFDKVK